MYCGSTLVVACSCHLAIAPILLRYNFSFFLDIIKKIISVLLSSISAAIMTPTILHSSPSHIQPQAPLSSDYDYISFRAHASFSPCQINTLSATPPRKSPNSSNYASPAPMLSPSPLRRRINFNDSAMDLDIPESFIGKVSTPFRSSSTKYSQLESTESPILFRGPDMSCDEEIAFFQSPYNAGSAPVQTPDRYVLQDLSSNIAHSDMSSQAHKRKV